jgi:hypothetical protein
VAQERFNNTLKLKELKESLKKFSSDFDEAEVILQFSKPNGESDFDLLSAVGMTKTMEGVVLLSYNETHKMIDDGRIDLKKFKKKN